MVKFCMLTYIHSCGMSAAADRKRARCRYNCLALYTFAPSLIHTLQFIECENENSMIIYIHVSILVQILPTAAVLHIDTKCIERHRYDVLALSYAYGIQKRLLTTSRPVTEREWEAKAKLPRERERESLRIRNKCMHQFRQCG
uniref:Uncharacterized protein n=1 Tax=Trichogramma kaykai TaxID=54128 RepID=A0ABD2WYC6_9HYME